MGAVTQVQQQTARTTGETVEFHTWEPSANSGKPLPCLHEQRLEYGP